MARGDEPGDNDNGRRFGDRFMDQCTHSGGIPITEADIYLHGPPLYQSCLAHAVEEAFLGRSSTFLSATGR